MKTVLMIAPYFIPRRRVGSLRPFKFAIHLRSFGYQPVILTIASPNDTCTDLEKRLLEDIPVIEVKPPFDRTTPSKKDQSEKSPKNTPVLDWFDKQTPLDSWIYLFAINYFQILRKVKKLDPDIIWATGDPWSGLWLGEKLSRKFSKPFTADFRDPWTLSNVNLRNRSAFSNHIDKKVEHRVILNADRVVFTSGLAEKTYIEEYKLQEKKARTIYNSYDPHLIEEHENEKWRENLNPNFLNILFFGRFRRLSPVTAIADALKELKQMAPEDLSTIHIHSFGKPDPDNIQLIREYGLEENFIFHKPVLPEKTLPVLKSADILLLSTNMEREQVIPAKLWDYLSVDVPILSIAPNPEVGDIIMRSKAGIQVQPDEKKEIAELLQSFSKAKRNGESFLLSPEKEIPDRKKFEAKQTTGELASLFDEILADG